MSGELGRELTRLSRRTLEAEDISEELPIVEAALYGLARAGETGTGNTPFSIPARKRLAIVRALRASGVNAWTSPVEQGATRAQLHVSWPEREDDLESL